MSLNKTIKLSNISNYDSNKLSKKIYSFSEIKSGINSFLNKTINGDSLKVLEKIPSNSIDLIIADPPYNLEKKYNKTSFKSKAEDAYLDWLDLWIKQAFRILKNTGSIYVCSDWKSSFCIYQVLRKYFIIQSRITWAREKGRGCNKNWKNNIEDIYFGTKSKKWVFNEKDIKIKRKVIAPYVDKNNKPKDWFDVDREKYRLTSHPNILSDLTIPFWSMNENTEHPTQKPEKLIAKLILASSNKNDTVLDPFLGSGTTSVVAKKLNRNYIGIEFDKGYCLISAKRLEMASKNKTIQGYNGKYFLDKGVRA